MKCNHYRIKRQVPMQYGFKDFNGKKWSSSLIDTYNSYTRQVNKYAEKPLRYDSLSWAALNGLLDRRHQFFVQAMEIEKEESR